jgi:hypothetical protein
LAISVSSTTANAGSNFTINFSGTANSANNGAGENFYSSSATLGQLQTFTTIQSCTGNTGPGVNPSYGGVRVPVGNLAAGGAFSGSVTLSVNPGAPAGSFVLRYQLYGSDGEATQDGPTITNAPPSPTVTSVSPTTGPPAGENTVTITGTNLTGATAISFGTAGNATAFSCTATSCTATAPAEPAGTVDVEVTTPGGTSAASSADQYTYAAAELAVTLAATAHPGLLLGHITYVITITDNGPSALTSATITAKLPTPMTAISSDCTVGSGPTVTCTIGALASGAHMTRTFTVPIGLLTLDWPYTVHRHSHRQRASGHQPRQRQRVPHLHRHHLTDHQL